MLSEDPKSAIVVTGKIPPFKPITHYPLIRYISNWCELQAAGGILEPFFCFERCPRNICISHLLLRTSYVSLFIISRWFLSSTLPSLFFCRGQIPWYFSYSWVLELDSGQGRTPAVENSNFVFHFSISPTVFILHSLLFCNPNVFQ